MIISLVVFFSTEELLSVSDSPVCKMTSVLNDVLKCRAEAALMAVESLDNLDESETEEVDTLEDDIENEFEPIEPSKQSLSFGKRQLEASYAAKFDLFQNLSKISTYKMSLMTITSFLTCARTPCQLSPAVTLYWMILRFSRLLWTRITSIVMMST